MTKKSTRGKKASNGGKTLRVSKQTLRDLTPDARTTKALKGGKGVQTRTTNNCGPGGGG
jgi:hypothetical protein